jgi:hypothetical protein
MCTARYYVGVTLPLKQDFCLLSANHKEHIPFVTGPPWKKEPPTVHIAPTRRLVDDVARRAYTEALPHAIVHTGPRSVLHMAPGTDHLHVLGVVIHIHL